MTAYLSFLAGQAVFFPFILCYHKHRNGKEWSEMEIAVNEALTRPDLLFVDVRSPAEYREASIPGAVNIPLFEDREHYQLSIIYYQLGEHEARRAALDMVAPKLPVLVEKMKAACGEKTPLLYCKRGGMRSLSLYQVLALTGIPAYRLKNGYKGYRRYIVERLHNYELKNRIFVLNGLTGVGKTQLLKELGLRGLPVLDLEGLARHRGSVFGAVGMDRAQSQKDFDALLLQQLELLSTEPYLVLEGEGRRIGSIYLPDFLVAAIKKGEHFLITAPLEVRVQRILDTYIQTPIDARVLEGLKTALLSLRGRLGGNKTERLAAMLEKGHYREVATILCTDYYDHFYSDSRPEYSKFRATIDATVLEAAAEQIITKINDLCSTAAQPAP